MKKIVIIGAAGRMGQSLIRCLTEGRVPGLELAGAVDLATNPAQGQDVGQLAGCGNTEINLTADLPALQTVGDVFIDFSFHSGIESRAALIASWGKGWVIGTTGLTEDEDASVRRAAERCPIVMAPNMSLGVNLLFSLVKQAAAALKGRGYDIEITEMHHRRKKDAPSGTALFLGEAAAQGSEWNLKDVSQHGREGMVDQDRPENEIGFHALRGGDVVGDHEVLFASEGEMVRLGHRATSRDTFAMGALQAASWLSEKSPGLYSMHDVLGM